MKQNKNLKNMLVPAVKSAKINGILRHKVNGNVYFNNVSDDFYKESMLNILSRHNTLHAYESEKNYDIVFEKSSAVKSAEGYIIKIGIKGVKIFYREPVGAYYACATVDRMLEEYGNRLPYCTIEDYPDREGVRGYSLDMARDRVLTLDSLKKLVDDISEMKMNVLMLYLELPSSVKLTENEMVVPDSNLTLTSMGTGLTTDELKELSAYAKQHYVDVIPFIETIGHLGNILQYSQYTELKETSGNCGTITVQNPESQKLLDRWIQIVSGCFDSEYFMIGGDEAGEVGTDKSIKNGYISHITGEPLKSRSDTYLDSLYILYNIVKKYKPDSKILVWHDMITNYCSTFQVTDAAELMPDMIPCIWNYEGYEDEFKTEVSFFNNVEKWNYWICPSTNSFSSITGRLSRCELNVSHAVEIMKSESKAEGFLITNWGDGGQKERLTTEYPGLCFGASKSWNDETQKKNAYDYVGKMLFGDKIGSLSSLIIKLQRENNLFTHSWGCGWIGKVGQEGYTCIDMLSAFLYYQYARGNTEIKNITIDDTVRFIDSVAENANEILNSLENYKLDTVNPEIIKAEIQLTAKMTVYYCEYVKMRVELIRPYYNEAKEAFGAAFELDVIGEGKFTAKLRELMGSDSLKEQIARAAEEKGCGEEYFTGKAAKMVEFSEKLYEEYEKVWYMANVKGGFEESVGTLKIPVTLFENVIKASK